MMFLVIELNARAEFFFLSKAMNLRIVPILEIIYIIMTILLDSIDKHKNELICVN